MKSFLKIRLKIKIIKDFFRYFLQKIVKFEYFNFLFHFRNFHLQNWNI